MQNAQNYLSSFFKTSLFPMNMKCIHDESTTIKLYQSTTFKHLNFIFSHYLVSFKQHFIFRNREKPALTFLLPKQ